MIKAKFKYNNANQALLCEQCNKIIKTGSMFTEEEWLASRGEIRLPAQYCSKCLKHPKTCDTFNAKYSKYLEEGYYGMAIPDKDIIEYMDQQFSKEIIANPEFSYSQIKTKFGSSRVYAESDKCNKWEDAIDEILTIKNDNIKEHL